MNADLNFNFKSLISSARKYLAVALKHAPFAVIIVVLFCFLFMVYKINQLASAEPSPDSESTAALSTKIPTIDSKAIKQIQDLEQNSPEVHSLFDAARNNPFQE